MAEPKKHHWWPVGLQKYWMDKNGDVAWINPNGKVTRKRAKNKQIGKKYHGHTISKGSVWETNFEELFSDVDNAVPQTIEALQKLKPLGRTPREFFDLLSLLFKKDRALRNMCKFHHLDERTHRYLLELIYSLLIRSPANRNRYENYPSQFGLKPNEEVGKANMQHNYLSAKHLCKSNSISNQFFVFIHSPLKPFIFGDGNLDWLTGNLFMNRIDGKALVPLTPNLCVYFCTPRIMNSTPNCAAFSAAPWQVNWVNEIVQIYSRDQLFFRGRQPKLTEAFKNKQFLEHGIRTDELIEMLDEVAGAHACRPAAILVNRQGETQAPDSVALDPGSSPGN